MQPLRVQDCISLMLIAGYCVATIQSPRADAFLFTRNSTNDDFYPLNRFFKNSSRMGSYQLHGELRDQCSPMRECREYAYQCSREGICECAAGHRPDQRQETCVGGIGSKCLYDSHCISNAYCKGQQICACKFEFPIASADSWTCRGSGSSPPISLGQVWMISLIISSVWTIC